MKTCEPSDILSLMLNKGDPIPILYQHILSGLAQKSDSRGFVSFAQIKLFFAYSFRLRKEYWFKIVKELQNYNLVSIVPLKGIKIVDQSEKTNAFLQNLNIRKCEDAK